MQKGVIIGLSMTIIILLLFAGYLIYSGNNVPEYQTEQPDYDLTKMTEDTCQVDSDCQTPAEFLLKSNCPYESRCLETR